MSAHLSTSTILERLAARGLTDEAQADFTAEELFDRVGRRLQERGDRAREEAEIVLAVLGDCVSADHRQRIARGLPGPAAQLFVADERELGEPPPHAAASRPRSIATVASSRQGSMHPLSEAAPTAGQTHSVARNPSPHEETKLSAAKGLTQERLYETLGSGRAPSR
jgi:hypothetical protein